MRQFIELTERAQASAPIHIRPDAIMGIKPLQNGCKLILFGGAEVFIAESFNALKATLSGEFDGQ
jgi:hypothetical protein